MPFSLARLPSLVALIFATLFAAACSEPPSKEMNQAQGAIDAARAAGAEQYAADELKAAVDALAQYEVAVTARDYRLALAHALVAASAHERRRPRTPARGPGRRRARARRATALVQRPRHG
jgi:hypothetical protein